MRGRVQADQTYLTILKHLQRTPDRVVEAHRDKTAVGALAVDGEDPRLSGFYRATRGISAISCGISRSNPAAAGMSQSDNNNGVKTSAKDRRNVSEASSPVV